MTSCTTVASGEMTNHVADSNTDDDDDIILIDNDQQPLMTSTQSISKKVNTITTSIEICANNSIESDNDKVQSICQLCLSSGQTLSPLKLTKNFFVCVKCQDFCKSTLESKQLTAYKCCCVEKDDQKSIVNCNRCRLDRLFQFGLIKLQTVNLVNSDRTSTASPIISSTISFRPIAAPNRTKCSAALGQRKVVTPVQITGGYTSQAQVLQKSNSSTCFTVQPASNSVTTNTSGSTRILLKSVIKNGCQTWVTVPMSSSGTDGGNSSKPASQQFKQLTLKPGSIITPIQAKICSYGKYTSVNQCKDSSGLAVNKNDPSTVPTTAATKPTLPNGTFLLLSPMTLPMKTAPQIAKKSKPKKPTLPQNNISNGAKPVLINLVPTSNVATNSTLVSNLNINNKPLAAKSSSSPTETDPNVHLSKTTDKSQTSYLFSNGIQFRPVILQNNQTADNNPGIRYQQVQLNSTYQPIRQLFQPPNQPTNSAYFTHPIASVNAFHQNAVPNPLMSAQSTSTSNQTGLIHAKKRPHSDELSNGCRNNLVDEQQTGNKKRNTNTTTTWRSLQPLLPKLTPPLVPPNSPVQTASLKPTNTFQIPAVPVAKVPVENCNKVVLFGTQITKPFDQLKPTFTSNTSSNLETKFPLPEPSHHPIHSSLENNEIPDSSNTTPNISTTPASTNYPSLNMIETVINRIQKSNNSDLLQKLHESYNETLGKSWNSSRSTEPSEQIYSSNNSNPVNWIYRRITLYRDQVAQFEQCFMQVICNGAQTTSNMTVPIGTLVDELRAIVPGYLRQNSFSNNWLNVLILRTGWLSAKRYRQHQRQQQQTSQPIGKLKVWLDENEELKLFPNETPNNVRLFNSILEMCHTLTLWEFDEMELCLATIWLLFTDMDQTTPTVLNNCQSINTACRQLVQYLLIDYQSVCYPNSRMRTMNLLMSLSELEYVCAMFTVEG